MYIKLIDREITASRFPWQKRTSVGILDAKNKVGDKYGWKPSGGMGRFGGGWEYELGLHFGGSTVMIQCLVGSVTVSKPSRCLGCSKPMLHGQTRGKGDWKLGAWNYHADCWDLSEIRKLEKDIAKASIADLRPFDRRISIDENGDDIPF